MRFVVEAAAATAFSRSACCAVKIPSVPRPYQWRELGTAVAQFYGSVGNVLCTTLWDPGCSDNFVTPEFAEMLIKRGARWKYCKPLAVDHGVGERGGVKSAAPAVRSLRADITLKTKGLTYVYKQAKFYIYAGALPDVMFSRAQLEMLQCVEQPGSKLLDWEMTMEDMESLAHVVDAAVVQCNSVTTSASNRASGADGKASKLSVQQLLREMCQQREELRARVGKAVSAEAEAAVAAVVARYSDNFRKPGSDPCKLGVFRIKLKDNTKSFVCLPRRTNPLVMEEMRRQVAEQEAAGVIERCETNPSSVYAICMARHPSKPGLRFCLDARPLNANTILMPYAVPDIAESLDRLAGYKMYSTFDLSAYFQQFELEESCRDLVAFLIPGDETHPAQIWRYKRLTFGLVNASFWAQKQLAEALAAYPGCETLRNFIDDICIGANTVDDMVVKVTALMEFCRHYNLRLKREKCQFCVGAVRHLGFVVSEAGKSLDPARVDSLINMKSPTNVKALKSLLGSFSFVRGWLADASTTTAPLTDLLSTAAKKRGWAWGQEQEDALASLKILAQTAPTLSKPDPRLPFHIYVDASDVGVGAVLVQWVMDESTGQLKARGIDYKSRRFSERERNWVVGEKEAFACKYGLEKFREYILLHPDVTLHCDHHNMLSMWSCASAKIARWRLYMQQYEPFKIVHVPGRDNIVADCLSRLHLHNLDAPATANIDDEEARLAEAGEGGKVDGLMSCTWTQVVSEVNSRFVQCNDARAARHRVPLVEGGEQEDLSRISVARDPDERALEALLRDAVHLTADKNAMEAEPQACEDDAAVSRLVEEAAAEINSEKQGRGVQWSSSDQRDAKLRSRCKLPNKRIISLAHDETHPSFATTWARVQRAMGLPPGDSGAKLKEEVKSYCDTCLVCAKLKPARQKLETKVGSIRQRPFTQYAFDLIVLSEPDSKGNRYIFTVVDSFSGAVELYALQHADVLTVADCLHDVLSRWSRPHSVRCDNAKTFAAAAVREMLRMARIDQHFVAPYSHVSNGQVENANRRVEYILRAMILDQRLGPASKLSWSRLLPAVRGVLNSRVVGRHGCTPNELVYGATSQRGAHIFEDEPWMEGYTSQGIGGMAGSEANLSTEEWRKQHQILLDKCEEVQDKLLQRLADAQAGQDDVGRLEPGDTVLLCVNGRKHHKLSAPWAGPYLVVECEPDDEGTNVVLVQHLATKVLSRVHARDLKTCSLDHFDNINEALEIAALDNFEYVVERILQHRPCGKRKQPGKRARPKGDYEFEVLWANLPLEEGENPSWEPWSNSSLRSCEPFKQYCRQPEVLSELGADFGDGDEEMEPKAGKGRRRRR